ncbi:hypothetical protein BGZ63DRAFT_396851 [Mariannaea sp. PMI_226]|nr:hypothetical protein BGZ63DRAFT_396851 [Mariannaea sp. PMI_226]
MNLQAPQQINFFELEAQASESSGAESGDYLCDSNESLTDISDSTGSLAEFVVSDSEVNDSQPQSLPQTPVRTHPTLNDVYKQINKQRTHKTSASAYEPNSPHSSCSSWSTSPANQFHISLLRQLDDVFLTIEGLKVNIQIIKMEIEHLIGTSADKCRCDCHQVSKLGL